MSRPAGSVARRSAAFTTIAARSRCRRGDNSFARLARSATCGDGRTFAKCLRGGSAFRGGQGHHRDVRLDRAHTGMVGEELAIAAHLGQILFGGILRVHEFDTENAAAGLWLAQRAASPVRHPAAVIPVEAGELEWLAVHL